MTKQTFQATNSLIKQTPSSYFKSNPTIQCSDTSFKVKPTKMLSVCGGRGLRPDPPSPTGVNLLLLLLPKHLPEDERSFSRNVASLKNMIQDKTNYSVERIQQTESTNLNIFRMLIIVINDIQYNNLLEFPLKTTHFCVLIRYSADCWLFSQAICPPSKKWFENNRKISITKEICITIDPPKKFPEESQTPRQGVYLKISLRNRVTLSKFWRQVPVIMECHYPPPLRAHFFLDCSYFKQNFLSLWRNLKLKITVFSQADGVSICRFIDNLDRHHKVLLLCLPFDNVTRDFVYVHQEIYCLHSYRGVWVRI